MKDNSESLPRIRRPGGYGPWRVLAAKTLSSGRPDMVTLPSKAEALKAGHSFREACYRIGARASIRYLPAKHGRVEMHFTVTSREVKG